MIIELNGLPGCGKSTLAAKLTASLEYDGYNVCGDVDVYYRKIKLVKFGELLCSFANLRCIKVNFWVVCLAMVVFCKHWRFKPTLNALSIIRCNWNIRRLFRYRHCDYIVISEGNVQYIAAMLDGTVLKLGALGEKLFKCLLDAADERLVVNCHVPTDVAMGRITSRTGFPNSVDRMEKKGLPAFMRSRLENMRKLWGVPAGKNTVVEADMTLSVDENVRLLRSFIDAL